MTSLIGLGDFEHIVLLAILRLGETAYGVTIRSVIAECTRRTPSRGALYTTLDRLENKGLVQSAFGKPTAERGGRAKRYFRITERGHRALIETQRSYQALLAGIDLRRGVHVRTIAS
jgi:PadR family transcriptional regulator PadR